MRSYSNTMTLVRNIQNQIMKHCTIDQTKLKFVIQVEKYSYATLHWVGTRLDQLGNMIKQGQRDTLNTLKVGERKFVIKFIKISMHINHFKWHS